MKRLEEGNEKALPSLEAAPVVNDETEKLDWNAILQQAPECGAPASHEGDTEGDEVRLEGTSKGQNCICSIM